MSRTGTTGRVVRANLRTWWPEILTGAFLAIFLLARTKDGAIFVVFELLVVSAGWAMGFRHRHRPIFEVIRRMDSKLDEALSPEDDDRPDAVVRHLHSV